MCIERREVMAYNKCVSQAEVLDVLSKHVVWQAVSAVAKISALLFFLMGQ